MSGSFEFALQYPRDEAAKRVCMKGNGQKMDHPGVVYETIRAQYVALAAPEAEFVVFGSTIDFENEDTDNEMVRVLLLSYFFVQ